MFGDALKEMAGVFDRRFLMHLFVPSLVFWGLLLALWFGVQQNLWVALNRWNGQEAFYKTLEVGCFLLWVYLFSSVLNSKLMPILYFYEGYWNFPGAQYFYGLGRKWHHKLLTETDPVTNKRLMSYEEIVRFYPNPRHGIEEIMPTRLGNILRNAELYPYERYNIRSVTAWPRLFPLLPAGFSAEVVIARSNLNFMLIISSLSAAFACVAGGYLLFAGTAWWFFLLCFWGGFIVAWIAYRGALSSALFVGTQIKVAFDLYRNELLKQMRVTLPTNSSEEKQTWRQLHQLFYQFKPLDLPYTANLAPPSSSSSEETDP